MSPEAKKIFDAVMELDVDQREAVIHALLEEVDDDPDVGYEKAWDDEIGRRIEEVESGRVKTIPGHEFLRELRARTSDLRSDI